MPDPGHPVIPPGPLVITTSIADGTVIVASDALLAQLDSLGQLAQSLRYTAAAALEVLQVLDHLDPQSSPVLCGPPAALAARRVTRAAVGALLTAQERAERLASGVVTCLTEYAQTEQLAAGLGHQVNEGVAWLLGAGARLFGLPMAVSSGAGILAGAAITGQSPVAFATRIQDFLKLHGRILTSPATVAIIRELAADTDGFGAGLLLLPPPVAGALESAKITGVPSSASGVVALGRGIGLFEPTGVAVRKTSSFEFGAPPTSLAARSESFPDPENDPNGEQIRIDRYVEAGKPDRFDIFIAGTVTFDPKTAGQPFDLTSDLNGVSNAPSASYDAVVSAMKQAGVTADSPVVLNGYSQGGLLASLVAASGNYNVHGVVTFGAPSAQVAIPASIPVLTVRNSEDLVPATSGYDVNPHAVVVQRAVFATGPVPSEWAVPAHRLSYYQETAAAADQANSSEMRAVLDPLNQFGAGSSTVDSTLWVATRVRALPAP